MHHEVENSAKLLWNSTRNTILEEEGIVGITRETLLRALIILCVLCYDDAELLSTFMSQKTKFFHFTDLRCVSRISLNYLMDGKRLMT